MRKGIASKLLLLFVAFFVLVFVPMRVNAETNNSSITITSQPSDYTGPVKSTAVFKVVAEGDGLTYQWQFYKNDVWKNTTLTGAESDALTVKLESYRDGYIFRCIVTDAYGTSVTSDEAILRIGEPTPPPQPESTITITKQPTDYIGKVKSTAVYTVEADGDDLSYQWQFYKNGVWKDTSLSGYNTDTLTVKLESYRDGYIFRCVISDSHGNSLTSDEAVLQIGEPPKTITITKQPLDYIGKVKSTAIYTVEAEGDDLSYQWQFYKNGVWKNTSLTGCTTDTLTVKLESYRDGYIFRCVISDSHGNSLTSDEAVLSIGVNTYAITFDALNGTFGDGYNTRTIEVDPGRYYFSEMEEPQLPGYSFEGWLYNGTPIMVADITSDMTVTADWFKLCKVTYNLNGGNINGVTADYIEYVDPGTFYPTRMDDLKRDNYVFCGWTYNNQSANRIRITNDITIYAQWTPGYLVTYDATEGHFGGEDVEQQYTTISSYQPAGTYFVGNCIERPVREGYYFDCWTLNGNWADRVNLTGPITFQARWYKDYVVTFDPNGGYFNHYDFENGTNTFNYNPETDTHREGEYHVGWTWPDKEGYEFIGWSTNPSATTVEGQDFDYYLDSDTTFYAIYVKCGKFTYVGNQGYWGDVGEDNYQTVRTEYVRPGRYYSIGTWNPYRPDYDFRGWRFANGQNADDYEYFVDSNMDITVYAQWQRNCTITYDANGGQFGEGEYTQTQYHWSGDQYRIGNWGPNREGYQFDTWYDAAEGGNAVDQMDIVIPEYDLTYYAHWFKIYTITYDANGGQFDGWNDDETQYIHYRTALEGEDYYIDGWNPYREGYEFLGWSLNGNILETNPIILTDDITLTAEWAKIITITYDANGGEFDGWNSNETAYIHYRTCLDGEEYQLDGWRPFLEGYEFIGWSLGGVILENDSIVLHDDITLKAEWAKRVLITYDTNGGRFNGFNSGNNETNYIHYRDALVGEYYFDGWRPERDEYVFKGWSLDKINVIEEPMTVQDDTTLYAVWYKPAVITYITTLGAWNDDGQHVTSIQRSTDDNGHINIDGWWPDHDDGYELLGYTTIEGSNIVEYELDEEIEFLANDMTLYTVWRRMPTITYNANKGKFNDNSDSRVDWYRVGRRVYVGQERPYREGYEFDGWMNAQSVLCDDDLLILQEGDAYTFYAKWVKIHTITYDLNGGDSFYDANSEDKVRDGDVYWVSDFRPDRQGGYRFLGWNPDQNATTASYDWSFIPHSDVTLYAIWEKSTVITFDPGQGAFYRYDSDFDEPFMEDYVHDLYMNEGDVILLDFIPFPQPELEGYSFDGWTLNGVFVDSITVGTEDITLVAHFSKSVTVTFDLNGATFNYFDPDVNDYVDSDYLELDWNTGDILHFKWLPMPVREGYVFAGWTLNDNYLNRLVVPDEDVTIVAQWIPET
ncbi:MAG: InlB B-repeat-containing protein [Aeriscardovia sp.]|nr:InlB B-repeat-containing protein [Aeriscardovia sp.]